MPFRHTVRVRYGECDMQGVVFNAHYLAYCDDAVDTWFRTAFAPVFEEAGFDFMLKRIELEWQAPLRFAEVADLDCAVGRWGSSSFDLTVTGTALGEPRFTARITYVSVAPGTNQPRPVPEPVRAALGS